MVGGRILQTGQPRDLYEHPAQLPVGRFLGRNNLIRAIRLSSGKSETGEFKTLNGGHTIRILVNDQTLAPLNRPCILAIRPEHVLIRQTAGNLENALPATVREINFAGATSSIKLDANGLLLERWFLKHAINLFISKADAGASETPSRVMQSQGFNVIAWAHDGLDYAAVSNLNPQELTEFARLYQEAAR